MEFPQKSDTVKAEWFIVYNEGSQVITGTKLGGDLGKIVALGAEISP